MGAGGGVADGICLQGLEACGPVGLVWRDPKNESEGCVEWQLQEKKHQTKKGLGFSHAQCCDGARIHRLQGV